MGVDAWKDTVVFKHKGKLYPFWQLADSNLFEHTANGRMRHAASWSALVAENIENDTLFGIPEDTPLDIIKERIERYFESLIFGREKMTDEVLEKAKKNFGFESGLYFNNFGYSGSEVPMSRYVSRLLRAYRYAVTPEQVLEAKGYLPNEITNKQVGKLISALDAYENESDKKKLHEHLREAAKWVDSVICFLWPDENKKIERLVAKNIFGKGQRRKTEKKYGVKFYFKDRNFPDYVYSVGRHNLRYVGYDYYRYTTRQGAENAIRVLKERFNIDRAEVIVKHEEALA